MSSVIICPECRKKLKVPESMAGKTIRCPACKSPIAADAELDDPAPASLVKTSPSPRSASIPSRDRPPRDEEPVEELELEEEEPIREKRPRKKRPSRQKSSSGLIIGLVVGGVLLLLIVLGGGVGLMVYLVRNKIGSDAGWLTFMPPGGDCTVLLPGTPQTRTQNVFGIQASQFLLERSGKEAFAIVIYDIPPRVLQPALLEEMAKTYRDGVMNTLGGGQAGSNKPISLGNIAGLEFQAKLTAARGMLIGRTYLAKIGTGHRLYLLAVVSDSLQPDSRDVVRFLDSFKITAPASPPNFADAVAGGGAPPPGINPPPMNPKRMNPPPNPLLPRPGPRMPRGPRRQLQ